MRRYKILMDVTETYEVFLDAEDDEEAADNAYTLSVEDIMSGEIVGEAEIEINKVIDLVTFYKEDS